MTTSNEKKPFPKEISHKRNNCSVGVLFSRGKRYNVRGGSRINFRVLQNFTKKVEHRNDVTCRKIIDSARSKKVQF